MNGITANALYQCLYEDLLDHDLFFESRETATAFAMREQLKALTKKLVTEKSASASDVALDKFLTVNERCGTWVLQVETMEDELLLGHLKDVLWHFVNPGANNPSVDPLLYSFAQILEHGSLGPGASIGAKTNDFYTKLFDSKLTTTSSGLLRAYTGYVQTHPRWLDAENHRSELHGTSNVVAGNRLSFVDKTNDTDRVICVEPVLNMFFQQGIKHILEDRLDQFFGIDLECQQLKNRVLARIGSESNTHVRDGQTFMSAQRGFKVVNSQYIRIDVPELKPNYVTIDLSSASDSLSIRMLETVFPADFLSWLMVTRSPKTQLPNGEWVALNMISTMGNAFTFPLQTALFSAVVVSAFRTAGLERYALNPFGRRLGNWAVNGDDIIVPEIISRKVLRLLKLLGFETNTDKTFVEGPFRESCGADFYNGVDVRPVFCKNLDTKQDLYSLINRLNQWSAAKGVPLRKTVSYLLRRVPRYEVPLWESADSGIWVPSSRLRVRPRSRQGSYLYKRYVPRQFGGRLDFEKEVLYMPDRKEPRVLNPEGLYLSFLRGTITSGRILLRPKEVQYVSKLGVAPNWDRHPTAPSPLDSVGGPGLKNLAHCTF